ncbi:MAG TPA: NYN domain-containing protein [Candidatus Limnocylindria bacterium]|nr:NYN domain-containing protein [Candidatus Limnocylindria bacterium]
MSKNVAVFVDVANIFYAAKAAGVDIDYVTLLKSAIAGRDFVRAYAYTGLDPDNENQRQFHSFLSRSGYKVISKDIRKYGDGRIKANLDIELVVDLMRMARNLDIAVVVSGDGDFAPAIRAVQQMGVRVEVISFRGNTSADLIEVADTFTDIAQIARVDKASSRSGRRVAAEGDLSMTAVPEKETEGAPRRRRSRRDERPAVEVAEAPGIAGNLIVLPGERLTRVGDDDGDSGEVPAAADLRVEELSPEAEEEVRAAVEGEDGATRRRRRRGGRGRGRGRRAEGEPVRPASTDADAAADVEDQEDFEEVAPAQLPHHTFGSVWDSQLGVPTASLGVSTELDEEDEELDEPEIPEYLLAERRQRSQRGRPGGGRTRAGYQAALDRERFGRSGTPTGGFGAGRTERQRPERSDRGRGRGQPRPGRQERPAREARHQPRPEQHQLPGSGDPWSEVPAELEELLRAELARKGETPATGSQAAEPQTDDEAAGASQALEAAQPARRTTRRRTTKTTDDESTATAGAAAADGSEAKPPARRRTTKAAGTKTGRTTGSKAKAEPDASSGADDEAAPADKKPARRRRTATPADSAEPAEAGES